MRGRWVLLLLLCTQCIVSQPEAFGRREDFAIRLKDASQQRIDGWPELFTIKPNGIDDEIKGAKIEEQMKRLYSSHARRRNVTLVMADSRNSGRWRAMLAQKRRYAIRHGYGFFLQGQGDMVIDPARAQYASQFEPPKGQSYTESRHSFDERMKAYDKGELRAERFGVLDAKLSWNKVGAAVQATQLTPDGSWLWIIDADAIIMNMSKQLDGVVAMLEEKDAHWGYTSWNCGDGVNAGSLLVRNNEWGRAMLLRWRDTRIVWQTAHIGDQGELWMLMASDFYIGSAHGYNLPPRTINARPAGTQCAHDFLTQSKVVSICPAFAKRAQANTLTPTTSSYPCLPYLRLYR